MIVLAALAAVALLLAVLVWAFLDYQHRQIFKPTRATGPLSPNPGEHGVDYESVRFGDRDQLHGWFLPLDPAADTLFFCHGNRGNLSDRVNSCLLYRNLGFNVFALDYRGYGLSAGRASEQGLYDDAFAAWQYLTHERGVPPSRIALLGRSLGGAVASHLACRTAPAAVVLEATFTSIADLASEHYGHLPQWGLGRIRFDNASRIGDIASPLLLVHSRDDAVIGFAHAQALAQRAPAGTALIEIGGDHAGGHLTSGAQYTDPVSAFLDRCGLTRRPPERAQTPLQRSV